MKELVAQRVPPGHRWTLLEDEIDREKAPQQNIITIEPPTESNVNIPQSSNTVPKYSLENNMAPKISFTSNWSF